MKNSDKYFDDCATLLSKCMAQTLSKGEASPLKSRRRSCAACVLDIDANPVQSHMAYVT